MVSKLFFSNIFKNFKNPNLDIIYLE